MPPQFLFDISGIDLNRIVYDQEKIRQCNPQRDEMEMLNGIVHAAPEHGQIIGYKDIRKDEFWVKGHIPGRPIFPGVLMIETGAQLASFYTRMFIGWKGFIGFGGANDVKFRMEISSGVRMYIVGLKTWERHGRICCNVQGVVEGNICFEASIIGVQM